MFISDHAIPTVQLQITKNKPGRGYWKLNNSLLNDDKLIVDMQNAIGNVFVDLKNEDIFLKWELMKLAVREQAIIRGTQLAKSRNNKLAALEKKLKQIVEQRDGEPEIRLFHDHDKQILAIQSEVEEITQYKVAGAMLRSRALWADQGEKPTKYFLNLEKHNFNRKTITRLRNPKDGIITESPDGIATILNDFYSDLYKRKNLDLDPDYLSMLNIPQVTPRDKYMLDAPIQLEEIHIALKQMKKSKCPGVDGLTPEFYLKVWPWIAKHITFLFNEIIKRQNLHSTARDGIIALVDA